MFTLQFNCRPVQVVLFLLPCISLNWLQLPAMLLEDKWDRKCMDLRRVTWDRKVVLVVKSLSNALYSIPESQVFFWEGGG